MSSNSAAHVVVLRTRTYVEEVVVMKETSKGTDEGIRTVVTRQEGEGKEEQKTGRRARWGADRRNERYSPVLATEGIVMKREKGRG